MNRAIVKQIHWLDSEKTEGEVVFEINKTSFWAFCHPCDFKEHEISDITLDFIEEEISERMIWEENSQKERKIMKDNNDRLRYYCYGRIKSIHPVIIDLGCFDVNWGDWIEDKACINKYVYFVISRLDIAKSKS